MKKINHLLVISPSFPKNEENGIVVPPLHLYLRQLRRDYPELKISVVSIHFPFHQKDYSLFDIDVYPCGGANGNLLARPLIWKRLAKKVKKLNAEMPIDLIHSFWASESTFLAQFLSKKYKVPHICTLMGQDAQPSNKYLRFINFSKMQVVTLSDFQKNFLLNHKKASNVKVIPWGIADIDLTERNSNSRPIDLLCVSSLIPLKRVHLFVELVAKLKVDFPGIKATIIGGGGLEGNIRKQISSLNLEVNIAVKGLLVRTQTLQHMSEAKALVHTSQYEAQGYVINEALARGCEVFALSKGFVQSDSKLHLCDDLDSLVSAVHAYIANPDIKFEPHIPISMAETVSKYEEVFQKIGFGF